MSGAPIEVNDRSAALNSSNRRSSSAVHVYFARLAAFADALDLPIQLAIFCVDRSVAMSFVNRRWLGVRPTPARTAARADGYRGICAGRCTGAIDVAVRR